jgi:hypothetical protein
MPCFGKLILLAALLVTPTALAGQPVTQTLTPPPPSYETCKAAGTGIICQGTVTFSYGPVYSGVTCGSGSSAVDTLDTATGNSLARRFYDENGKLVRRMLVDHYTSAQFGSPLTGATVPYTETLTNDDVLAVPGDLGSMTRTTTGEFILRPARGAPVFMDVGRTIVAPDGTLDFRAGPQNFFDLYVDGDTSVADRLCAALGAS